MNRGILYAVGAYVIWGVLPVFWKALQVVPSVQILSHRVVWSVVLLALLVTLKHEWVSIGQALRVSRTRLAVVIAACLLVVNWLTYIWGVNAGYIVETSLGYFINPLVNVMLGVIFLREKLRPLQWLPVGLAFLGVFFLTFSYGRLPWIALVLAFSFGFYGLVKKITPLGALQGLTLETGTMFIPALLYLLYVQAQGTGSFGGVGLTRNILLIFTGVVTALPMLLFGMGVHRIDLTTIGILQYIAPTCQFLIGVLVYGEPITLELLIGFSIIWLALIIYTVEGLMARRKIAISVAV